MKSKLFVSMTLFLLVVGSPNFSLSQNNPTAPPTSQTSKQKQVPKATPPPSAVKIKPKSGPQTPKQTIKPTPAPSVVTTKPKSIAQPSSQTVKPTWSPAPTSTPNFDIQRLQKDPTIAQSGNYGRTPGGIVDLRTGQIVAPSSVPPSQQQGWQNQNAELERQKKALQEELARKQKELAEAQKRKALQEELARKQKELAELQKRQAREASSTQQKTQQPTTQTPNMQQADLERRRQALQQELARRQKELSELQQRQVRETAERQRQSQQTVQKQFSQTEPERQRQTLQQELARKQKELTELQQRQAREASTKQQKAQQAVPPSTTTVNADIQRLQKDSTIALSGNYRRAPGGIVDLRTGQIVAPSLPSPIVVQPKTPPAPTQKLPVVTTKTAPTPPLPSPIVVQQPKSQPFSPAQGSPSIISRLEDLTRTAGTTPATTKIGKGVPSLPPPPDTAKTLSAPPTTGQSISGFAPTAKTLGALLTSGGSSSNNTAGTTPATIGIPTQPGAKAQALRSVVPGTSSGAISSDEKAKMEATLQRRRRLLETGPPNLQAIDELGLADKALKEGRIEEYKKHLDQSWKLTEAAADAASNKAYKDDRLLRGEAKLLVPQYGNYGGPGWTGGWTRDYKLEPINKMDAAFQRHDEDYGRAKTPEDTIKADQQLVADLRAIRGPSDLLGKDGRGRTYYETVDEDMRYRDGAIKVFEVKIAAEKADLMRTRTLQGIENGTEKIGDWAKAKIKGLLDILPN